VEPVGDDLALKHDHGDRAGTRRGSPDGNPRRRIGPAADAGAHSHQDQSTPQHQPIAESSPEQAERQGDEHAQHVVGADEVADLRIAQAEPVDEIGRQRGDGLELVAKGHAPQRQGGENDPGAKLHTFPRTPVFAGRVNPTRHRLA
jgi:hypothetical protein